MPQGYTPQEKRKRPGKYESNMYYRRPANGQRPGWIIVGGVKGEKRRVFEDIRGFKALPEFGELPHGHTNPWEHILTSPGGPEAFPVDQVMSLRWYNEDDIPTDCEWEGKDEEACPMMIKLKTEGVVFPQLTGHTIIEHSCPECDRPPFSTVDGMGGIEPLARHLKIMHGWDAQNLMKWGEATGIDFQKVYSKERMEKTFDFTPSENADFSCTQCDWKPDGEGAPSKQLAGHKMGAHKEPVTA